MAQSTREQFPDQTLVIHFESLIGQTESVMRRVADTLEIAYMDSLTMPTFNQQPVLSNSRFEPTRGAISKIVIEDRRQHLEPAELAVVEPYAQQYDLQAICDI